MCIYFESVPCQGGETQVRAKFYSMAFQQQYLDEDEEGEGVVKWKVVEYDFGGDMPYL